MSRIFSNEAIDSHRQQRIEADTGGSGLRHRAMENQHDERFDFGNDDGSDAIAAHIDTSCNSSNGNNNTNCGSARKILLPERARSEGCSGSLVEGANEDDVEDEDDDSRQTYCKQSVFAQAMRRSQWKINNTFAEGKLADFSKICSICLSDLPIVINGKEKVTQSELISACLCSGVRAKQHKCCIENWIELTGATSCPFCLVRFEYRRKRRSFCSYVRECQLEQDMLATLTTLAFSLYLFTVGLSTCLHYLLYDTQNDEQYYSVAQSWTSLVVFCFVCALTTTLLLAIISLALNTIVRHSISYHLWSRTYFKVDVRPYKLEGATSEPVLAADGLPISS